jgi:hypothetical protein
MGDVAELDSLLEAMFDSRSWWIGRRITTWMRLLNRRSSSTSVADRWNESRRRRLNSP